MGDIGNVIAIDMETMEVVFGLYPEDKIVAVVAVIGLLVVHAIVIPIVSVAEPSADHLGKDSNGIAWCGVLLEGVVAKFGVVLALLALLGMEPDVLSGAADNVVSAFIAWEKQELFIFIWVNR